ncbi:glycosyltransferase family 4 protein [Neobacillus sp. NPDC093127]|uniref:glycosyltransferase family 4 protein n=1 Tax=Neobacillus sp. NPDC093127 TaxID=3364296 RepID=UPI0037FFA886
MNVCFLLGGFSGTGGIGRVTSILANEICKSEGYKVHTLSFYNNQKEKNYVLDLRIKQDYLFQKPINMTKGILNGGISKLRKYLLNNDIDILVACGALYYPITILSSIGTKTKTICWEHSNVRNSKDHSYQLLSRRIGAKKANKVVTLTKHDQKMYLEKYRNNNVIQIYNPIDEEIFKYIKKYKADSKKIISVGRFSYQKNFELLIDIANNVLHKNRDWTWDIYGDGELRNTLETKIKEYKLENQLFLKGSVNNLYKHYPDYAFLVMTSRYEGFPMSLLEGMAHGLPLISFDVLTGPNEIIRNGDNGFLIESFDKQQMISNISFLIDNQEERIKMSYFSKEICEQYKINEIVNQWKSLFEEILI